MMRRLTFLLLACAAPVLSQAQTCDAPYTVGPQDTVFTIAQAVYGDPEKWTLLYYSNEALLKAQLFQVAPGDVLTIPCDAVQAMAPTPVALPDPAPADAPHATERLIGPAGAVELSLVTAASHAPFTARDWPGHGMVTELVDAALAAAPDPVSYAIDWRSGASSDLVPVLENRQYDMGFPAIRPDCAVAPDNRLCAQFHFSDPVVDKAELLFVARGGDIGGPGDLGGTSLCRVEGAGMDLPDDVTLVGASDAAACFDLLLSGKVDAVAADLFEGAQAVDRMGLHERVAALDAPLWRQSLHVVIPKSHWRGTTHLYRLNAGLQTLRDTGRYDRIVAAHLKTFWAGMPPR